MEINKKTSGILLGVIIFTLILGIIFLSINSPFPKTSEKIDDWNKVSSDSKDQTSGGGFLTTQQESSAPASDLGFATGGAKDINNFRDNIENNYLPIPEDISYEGLFYDYYFDTGQNQEEECKELFCPSYNKIRKKHLR